MKRNIILLLTFIFFVLISTVKCQDVGGIFEAGEEPEDEEFVGTNNIIDTPQVRVEGSNEVKDKKDSKSSSSDSSSNASPSTDEKFSSAMDEEEFDGLDSQKTDSKDNKNDNSNDKNKQANPNQPIPQNFKPMSWIDFIPEFLTLSFILVYCAFYFKNNKNNEKKILKWMENNRDILIDNFTSIKNIVKMSTNEFRIKCTGRLNCIGMEMNFTFKREHDLVYTLLDKFYPLVEEKVTIDIPVGESGTMPTFTLIMMQKSKIANFKKDNASISAVTTEVQDPKFPSGHSILVDTKDLIPLIISKESRSVYKRLEKYVESIYINDQHHEQPEFPNFIRFVFRIPPNNQDFRSLFLTCFNILDRSVELEMPKLVKEKVSKKRLELQKAKLKYEHEKREERSQQLKDEKKKKLMESKDELSEKELSKLEAKERKKNLKKASGKMKRVVVG